jgi:signal transduction histidine kinase
MMLPMRLQPFQSRYAGLPTQLKYAMLLTLVAGFMGDELGISAQVIEVVRHEQRLLEVSLFVLFLLSITITFTTTFFVTRKLTGPVVALERHLWHYVRGDWSRDFRLRRNDEFKELETLMNQLRSTMLTQANRRTEGQRDSA